MPLEELECNEILCKCDMCKKNFGAYHYIVPSLNRRNQPPISVYNDTELTIDLGKRGKKKVIVLSVCPECTEKLLELLDRHFPRLNLEDKL